MKPDKDCPECGARKIHHTVSVCEVCETWAKAERQIACLEREVARLREGEECHVARPGEGTYECRHDNLCAACRLRSAEARANRATYTVGETEWAHRIAVAEQRFVDEYDAHQETRTLLTDLYRKQLRADAAQMREYGISYDGLRKLFAEYDGGDISLGKVLELLRAAAREIAKDTEAIKP